MFVPVVAGSDKTTVSVATGHQEYHPVYMSPGNLTNIARRSHGSALLPVTFLPIPKSMHAIYCFDLFTDIHIQLLKNTGRTSTFRHSAGKCTTRALARYLSP
jgi:hypothetical protein